MSELLVSDGRQNEFRSNYKALGLWISDRRPRPQKKTLECSDLSKLPFYLDFNLIGSAQQLTFNLSSCSKGIESPKVLK